MRLHRIGLGSIPGRSTRKDTCMNILRKMAKKTEEVKEINESSLYRLHAKMMLHDTGVITASKAKYTYKENKQRNLKLLAQLIAKRYRVTRVRGGYIENFGTSEAIKVGENSFFVEDWKDKGKLERDLRKLGEEWDQDSILFIPKGATKTKLWGTSKKKDAYPSYDDSSTMPTMKLGKGSEFYTSIRNRPFVFEAIEYEYSMPDGVFGRMGAAQTAKKDWREFDWRDRRLNLKE